MYNNPVDISPLVNMAAGEKLLPETKGEFEGRYIENKQVNPGLIDKWRGIKPGIVQVVNQRKKKELQNIFQKWVDYEPGSKEGFPSVEEEEIRVPMTAKQLAIYDTIVS